jgi:regulator of sigma D
MATTINIQATQVTGTVSQQQVVAKPTITNYATSNTPTPGITTANVSDSSLTISESGLDQNSVPTTIRSRSEGDQVNLTDLTIRVATYRRTITDPLTATDNFSKVVNFKRTFTHSATAQESNSIKVNILKTDRINAGDNVLKSIRSLRTDVVNVSNPIYLAPKPLQTDRANVLESIKLTPKPVKTDNFTATENFARVVNYLRTLTDRVNATDDYLGNANIDDDQYVTFIKGLVISVQASEFTAKQIKTTTTDKIDNISDVKFITIKVPKTDNFTATETFSRIVSYNRTQSDQINFSENILKNTGKLLSDSVNVSETKFASIRILKTDFINCPAETIQKSISAKYSDTSNVLEFIAKNIALNGFSDLFQVSETPFKSPRLLKTDAASAEDRFSRTIAYKPILTDQVTATDDYQGLANIDDDQYVTFGKNNTDTVNFSELLPKNVNKILTPDSFNILETKYASLNILKTDSGTTSDQASKSIQLVRNIASNVSESLLKNIGKFASDLNNVSETSYSNVGIVKTDYVNLTDPQLKNIGLFNLDRVNIAETTYKTASKILKDVINTIDQLALTPKPVLIDQINIAESLLTYKYTLTTLQDSSNVADKLLKNIGLFNLDAINFSENFTRTANYQRTFEELVYPDFLVLENLLDFLLLENGDFLTTESGPSLRLIDSNINFKVNMFKTDIVNVQETPLKNVNKLFANGVNAAESFARVVNYLRTLTDQVNATDDYLGNANIDDDQYVTFNKRVTDIVNIAETTYKTASKILKDVINTIDQLALTPKPVRIDQANFTETVTTFKFIWQKPADTINVSNLGKAYAQSYFADPNYTTPGYTGTITTFT